MTVSARSNPQLRKIDPGFSPRWQTALTLLVMAAAVLAVYFPIRTNPGDNTLVGLDYLELHRYRIQFAQEALFSAHPHLPGWYPRELLGTPFWSNIQNFPLLPTRLVLLAFDPLSAYAIGIILAAELAALFAFLLARSLGLGHTGAAAAAWTFACTGYFASRVMSGQLPLLEAYPALPLLLWLVHRCVHSPSGRRRSGALRFLGAATTIVCLSGHPQLPLYAIASAAAYAIWMNLRRPGATRGDTLRILTAMVLGAGVAAFVLWPMMLLVARSSRFLPLGPVADDVAFPLRRLLAFLLPWRDGWPPNVARPLSPPTGFGDRIVFWETVCYVGVLPVLAAGYWLTASVLRRKGPRRDWAFLASLGIAGLLLALPPVHNLFTHLPGTILRSPARLLYLTVLALSFAFGAGIDRILSLSRPNAWAAAAVAVLLIFQLCDLGRHDRAFIRTIEVAQIPELDERVKQSVGDGRAAIDHQLMIGINREVDDVGFYDSIALLKPYVALVDLGHLSLAGSIQSFDGSQLNARALRVCGVRVMLTTKFQSGPADALPPPYFLPGAAHRVDFFPLGATITADVATIHRDLRDPNFDLLHRLLLPAASPVPPASAAGALPADIGYTRDSEDQMTISATVHQPGYLRINEAWDPGWHATVDGAPASIVAGDDLFLAVPLSAGYHTVRLEFSTPGFGVGCVISVVCFALLMWITRPPTRSAPRLSTEASKPR